MGLRDLLNANKVTTVSPADPKMPATKNEASNAHVVKPAAAVTGAAVESNGKAVAPVSPVSSVPFVKLNLGNGIKPPASSTGGPSQQKGGASTVLNSNASEVTKPVESQTPAGFVSIGKLGLTTKQVPSVGVTANKPAAEVDKQAPQQANSSSAVPFSDAKEKEDFNHPDMVEKLSGTDVESLKEAISILHNSFEHPELVSNATRNILITLKENPELIGILHPEDFQLMVRALRESYGIVVSSKQNNKNKRVVSAKSVEDIGNMIGDIEIEI